MTNHGGGQKPIGLMMMAEMMTAHGVKLLGPQMLSGKKVILGMTQHGFQTVGPMTED